MPAFKKAFDHFYSKEINHFNKILVPDFDDRRLSGELSIPAKGLQHVQVKCIGPLSRFMFLQKESQKQDFNIVLIGSGPQPQRGQFIKEILEQINLLESGLRVACFSSDHTLLETQNVQFYPHLHRSEFFNLIANASTIISRGGYTTVMDSMYLQSKFIFIPTPFQYEQLYLSRLHSNNDSMNFLAEKNLKMLPTLLSQNQSNGNKKAPISMKKEGAFKKITS